MPEMNGDFSFCILHKSVGVKDRGQAFIRIYQSIKSVRQTYGDA